MAADRTLRRNELDLLPVGVVHVDAVGTVLRANRLFAELLGMEPDKLVGRNLLEFGADDPTRYLDLLTFSSLVTTPLMGPVAATYHAADGTLRRTNFWSRDLLDDPDVGAIVCVATAEEARDGVADALASIAEAKEVDQTLSLLAGSIRGHPFDCTGCWLLQEGDQRRIVGTDGIDPGVRSPLEEPGPWWDALADRSLHEVCDTAAETRNERLALAGVAAWWLLPVTGVPELDAGLLVLRRFTGPPSPNQIEHLREMTTIARLAIDQRQLRQHLAHAASHDPLTGLANRSRFFGRSEDGSSTGIAVLSVDLDHFKPVNDQFGHGAGDEVLVTVAERLRRTVRPGDHVARLGGDEFVVECLGVATQTEATEIAERIVQVVRAPIDVAGIHLEVGASVGVAWSGDRLGRAQLLERSDRALIRAKRAGRGRWVLAPDEATGPVSS